MDVDACMSVGKPMTGLPSPTGPSHLTGLSHPSHGVAAESSPGLSQGRDILVTEHAGGGETA